MRIFVAAIFLCTPLGCDRAGKADEPVEDPRGMVRAALLDGSNCYGETSLLCIDEETFVDSAIEAALEVRWKGQMPKKRSEVEQVIRSARSKYRKSMRSPIGLETLERLVQARYEDPAIDTDTVPGVVSVDLGALPGELRDNARGRSVVLRKTDLIDGFEWKAEEAGRQLAKYADAYPDAEEIRVEVRYPASSRRHFVYRYLRASNQVVHEELEVKKGRNRSQYVSKPIEGGLQTLRDGNLRLGDGQGERCYASRGAGGSTDCRIADRYREAKKG